MLPRRARARERTWRAVAVVVAIGLVGGTAACGARSGGTRQSATRRDAVALVATPEHDLPRVLIFGDSIAAQHGAPAVVALREAGIEAEVFGLWGHGLFSRDQYDMGVTNPAPPPGTLLEAATNRVENFGPDLVAVYVNHNYWPPYPRDAAGNVIDEGTPAFAAMARTQLTELVRRLRAGGADVELVEPVPEREGQTAADNPIWSAYLPVAAELGVPVIDAGEAVAAPDGVRIEAVPDCGDAPSPVRPPGDIHLTYFGSGVMGTRTARALADVIGIPSDGVGAPTDAPVALLPMGTGYRVMTCDGATFRRGVGGATWGGRGLAGRRHGGDPVVGAAESAADSAAEPAGGDGAWVVTASGTVAGLGSVRPEGLDVPVAEGDRAVAVAAAPGGGAWVATARGTVFGVGGAAPVGDLAGRLGGDRVVAIASRPDGAGYWLATAGGTVTALGSPPAGTDAVAHPGPEAGTGERATVPGLGGEVVAMAANPAGAGLWVLDATGRVHPLGGAPDLGSAADQPLTRLARFGSVEDVDTVAVPASEAPTTAVALLATATGAGYRVLLRNGAVCSFGDAHPFGGIHRAEVDEIMIYRGQEYYAEGPCIQDVGFGPPNS